MRVVIAAGGTAGHVNPAIAIANEIKKHEPDSDIIFFGADDTIETVLVPKAGYELHALKLYGFSRRWAPKSIWVAIKTVVYAMRAQREAKRVFKNFKPDIVIGCGGYASGPIVRKAVKMKIPTAIHEQNAAPGMTTKLLSRMVDLIMLANKDTIQYLDYPQKCVVTGNPVREAFFVADRDKLRRQWGVGDRVCVVSFGGSLGARPLNQIAARFMKRHVGTGRVYHIHATGEFGTKLVQRLLEEYGVDANSPELRIVEYIEDMPECLAAADLVISRAGALTVSEIAAAGVASVLVPSPYVTANHQYYNAKTLADAGAALLFEEKDIDAEEMTEQLFRLCIDRQRLRMMGIHARRTAPSANAAEQIYNHIKELLNRG